MSHITNDYISQMIYNIIQVLKNLKNYLTKANAQHGIYIPVVKTAPLDLKNLEKSYLIPLSLLIEKTCV